MSKKHFSCIGTVGCSLIFAAGMAHGQEPPGTRADLADQVESMKKQLSKQQKLLDSLMQSLRAQKIRVPAMSNAVAAELLEQQRGAGAAGAAEAPQAAQATSATSATPTSQQATPTAQTTPAAGSQASAAGKAPASRPPEVAPIFEQPGVLTAKGKFVLEPALQYGYSSSNRVALIGYTIIPALLIGLVDVREVKRNTMTAALTGRTGLSNRFEIEARVPYVYRSDATISRPFGTGAAQDNVFDTSGKALGDVELAARYQLNNGGVDKPFYVAGLRFKSRTGRDPFSVVTDCTQRCINPDVPVTGTGLPLELPTGSGFYSLQPSLTWLLPSDPAVFFGSFSYLYNFSRSNVSRRILSGQTENLGTIAPGGVIGFNFGMGLALNDKASVSLGYDHSSIGRTMQDGKTVAGSVRTQLGTMLLGFSYRLSAKKTLSVSVGAGLTRDTPDVSLTVRLPTNF